MIQCIIILFSLIFISSDIALAANKPVTCPTCGTRIWDNPKPLRCPKCGGILPRPKPVEKPPSYRSH